MKRLNINLKGGCYLQAFLVDIANAVASDSMSKNCCMVTYRVLTILTNCYSHFSACLDKTLIGRIVPVANGKVAVVT